MRRRVEVKRRLSVEGREGVCTEGGRIEGRSDSATS